MSQIPTLKSQLASLIDGLGSEADIQRGFRDIVLETRAGEKIPVRINAPIPAFRPRLLLRISTGEDPAGILPCMVAPEFSTPEFLNGLTSLESLRFRYCAAAMVIGPDLAKEAVRKNLGLEPI